MNPHSTASLVASEKKVGRNCKIGGDLRPEDFSTGTLASGETIEDCTFAHGWKRELARRRSSMP